MEDVDSLWGTVVVRCSADVSGGIQWRSRAQPRECKHTLGQGKSELYGNLWFITMYMKARDWPA